MDLHIKLHSSTGSTDGLNAALLFFYSQGKKRKEGEIEGTVFITDSVTTLVALRLGE